MALTGRQLHAVLARALVDGGACEPDEAMTWADYLGQKVHEAARSQPAPTPKVHEAAKAARSEPTPKVHEAAKAAKPQPRPEVHEAAKAAKSQVHEAAEPEPAHDAASHEAAPKLREVAKKRTKKEGGRKKSGKSNWTGWKAKQVPQVQQEPAGEKRQKIKNAKS